MQGERVILAAPLRIPARRRPGPLEHGRRMCGFVSPPLWRGLGGGLEACEARGAWGAEHLAGVCSGAAAAPQRAGEGLSNRRDSATAIAHHRRRRSTALARRRPRCQFRYSRQSPSCRRRCQGQYPSRRCCRCAYSWSEPLLSELFPSCARRVDCL